MKICTTFTFLLFFTSSFLHAGLFEVPKELFNEVALYCQHNLKKNLKSDFEIFLEKREGGTVSRQKYICKKGNKKLIYKLNEERTAIIRECEGWDPVTIFEMPPQETIQFFALSPRLSKIIILKDDLTRIEGNRLEKTFYVVDRNNHNESKSIILQVSHDELITGVAISNDIYFSIIKEEGVSNAPAQRDKYLLVFDQDTTQEIKKVCFWKAVPSIATYMAASSGIDHFYCNNFSFDKNSAFIGVKYTQGRTSLNPKISFTSHCPTRHTSHTHIESLLPQEDQGKEWGDVLKKYICQK